MIRLAERNQYHQYPMENSSCVSIIVAYMVVPSLKISAATFTVECLSLVSSAREIPQSVTWGFCIKIFPLEELHGLQTRITRSVIPRAS